MKNEMNTKFHQRNQSANVLPYGISYQSKNTNQNSTNCIKMKNFTSFQAKPCESRQLNSQISSTSTLGNHLNMSPLKSFSHRNSVVNIIPPKTSNVNQQQSPDKLMDSLQDFIHQEEHAEKEFKTERHQIVFKNKRASQGSLSQIDNVFTQQQSRRSSLIYNQEKPSSQNEKYDNAKKGVKIQSNFQSIEGSQVNYQASSFRTNGALSTIDAPPQAIDQYFQNMEIQKSVNQMTNLNLDQDPLSPFIEVSKNQNKFTNNSNMQKIRSQDTTQVENKSSLILYSSNKNQQFLDKSPLSRQKICNLDSHSVSAEQHRAFSYFGDKTNDIINQAQLSKDIERASQMIKDQHADKESIPQLKRLIDNLVCQESPKDDEFVPDFRLDTDNLPTLQCHFQNTNSKNIQLKMVENDRQKCLKLQKQQQLSNKKKVEQFRNIDSPQIQIDQQLGKISVNLMPAFDEISSVLESAMNQNAFSKYQLYNRKQKSSNQVIEENLTEQQQYDQTKLLTEGANQIAQLLEDFEHHQNLLFDNHSKNEFEDDNQSLISLVSNNVNDAYELANFNSQRPPDWEQQGRNSQVPIA
eukprot:403343285